MICPKCLKSETRVVETRRSEDGETVRRRRECEKCNFRFSTYEEIQLLNLTVIKKDRRKEAYGTEKMARGIRLSFSKRPITDEDYKKLIQSIEREIQVKAKNNQIASEQIGEIVMRHLKRKDKVAYIRFASVYEDFGKLGDFKDKILQLTKRT